jgi:enamine deaminase RidA (YjgF/YER057c/UK114 family)
MAPHFLLDPLLHEREAFRCVPDSEVTVGARPGRQHRWQGRHARQIRQVGENLKTALAAAGATLNNLVKTTTFVTDIDEFFWHANVRMEYFGPALPTSMIVEVRRVAHPDLLVEIEAIAMAD